MELRDSRWPLLPGNYPEHRKRSEGGNGEGRWGEILSYFCPPLPLSKHRVDLLATGD